MAPGFSQFGASGVVFLSGNRHIGALYRQADDLPYPPYEITLSGINRAYLNADEPGPLGLGDMYRHENFGSIDIDWPLGTMTLAVRDKNGQPVHQVAISFLMQQH